MIEVRCQVCGSAMKLGDGSVELKDGIHYLIPETIRNENVNGKANARMEALKKAGIDVSKLQTLMSKDDSLKGIFAEDDPILDAILKGGFIKNNELFRRWITAQTFRLLRDSCGWTHAVRKTYNTKYVFKQTVRELDLLIKLKNKRLFNDVRFNFFTLDAMKDIFCELVRRSTVYSPYNPNYIKSVINACGSYTELRKVIGNYRFRFSSRQSYLPKTWLNCFKGAGAYYTLQNIIRTHGFILPSCTDMHSSLDTVESLFNEIAKYDWYERRWDLMLSLLTTSIGKTGFELKY